MWRISGVLEETKRVGFIVFLSFYKEIAIENSIYLPTYLSIYLQKKRKGGEGKKI